jgi:hypothetical protein
MLFLYIVEAIADDSLPAHPVSDHGSGRCYCAGTARVIPLPQAELTDDIIVEGLRIPREKLPTAVYWNYQSMLAMRILRENSEMFMRCALKSTDVHWLREVVDGESNSADARFAQGRISQTHRGCYPPDRSVGLMLMRFAIGTADLGGSRIDHRVIVEQVMTNYGPMRCSARNDRRSRSPEPLSPA